MDNSLIAVVTENAINLPIERRDELIRQIRRNTISQLSPEKEAGPFALYMLGDSIEAIALKTNYPIDVICLTAIYYRWEVKVGELRALMESEDPVKAFQKDLANLLLVATLTSARKQLGDIIAGRADAKSSFLMPKNIAGVERLMAMINSLNEKPEAPQTSITATNVQINQGLASFIPAPLSPEKQVEMEKKKLALAKKP